LRKKPKPAAAVLRAYPEYFPIVPTVTAGIIFEYIPDGYASFNILKPGPARSFEPAGPGFTYKSAH
jgi:hypothetical protein